MCHKCDCVTVDKPQRWHGQRGPMSQTWQIHNCDTASPTATNLKAVNVVLYSISYTIYSLTTHKIFAVHLSYVAAETCNKLCYKNVNRNQLYSAQSVVETWRHIQTMNQTINSSIRRSEGDLQLPHEADKSAIIWLQTIAFSNKMSKWWLVSFCLWFYQSKFHPGPLRPIRAGISQGIVVSIAMAHKGVMWLAPRSATFHSLLCKYPSKLGGQKCTRNRKPISQSCLVV